jgi:putative tRNA adenosine deaminase-associated protein
VSHFAALVARSHDRWKGSDLDEVELAGLDDIEDVADLMRDASIDDGPVLMFVEEDDEWFGMVRVDGAGEPKVFISDARVVAVSELAGVLFQDLVPEDVADEAEALAEDEDIRADDDEPASVKPAAEPGGATDLLTDFGISSQALLEMCAEEGALPADVITAICERLGCAEEIEVYR